jgi:hypothetical protein
MQEKERVANQARQALRRIRGAVVGGGVTPREMQQESTQVLDRFASAMLQLENRSDLLRPEHQDLDNVAELNQYVANLLTDVNPLSVHDCDIHSWLVDLMVRQLDSDRAIERRLGGRGVAELKRGLEVPVVALLSTGAMALAGLSYVYNFPVLVAAVEMEGNQASQVVLSPEVPERASQVVVYDDVFGSQWRAVKDKLEQKLVGTGTTIIRGNS